MTDAQIEIVHARDGPNSPIDPVHQKCGFGSLAKAKRAKAAMQKHRSGVKVVAGGCPAFWEDLEND